MKVWIGLVTPDGELREFFGRQKSAIVPHDSLKEQKFGGHKLALATSAYISDNGVDVDHFERFVLTNSRGVDATILLVDENWIHLAANLRAGCLVVPLDSFRHGATLQNFMQKTASLSLRVWWQIRSRFSNARDIQLLSLPLRNFQADELMELTNAVRLNAASPSVGEHLDKALKGLRGRVRPRRRSSSKAVYAVDDRERFFSYGKERHSSPETGGEHKISCEINANFRFGCRIDCERHFNVSETEGDRTSISGEFSNCHGERTQEKRDTHLNMFANDMFY